MRLHMFVGQIKDHKLQTIQSFGYMDNGYFYVELKKYERRENIEKKK